MRRRDAPCWLWPSGCCLALCMKSPRTRNEASQVLFSSCLSQMSVRGKINTDSTLAYTNTEAHSAPYIIKTDMDLWYIEIKSPLICSWGCIQNILIDISVKQVPQYETLQCNVLVLTEMMHSISSDKSEQLLMPFWFPSACYVNYFSLHTALQLVQPPLQPTLTQAPTAHNLLT